MVFGVLHKLEKKCFEKQIVLLFDHEKLFPSCFQWALTVFDVFDRFLVFVLFCRF